MSLTNFIKRRCLWTINREMNRKVYNCFVKPVNGSFNTVTLPHNEIVYIGRNRETLISDILVSRKQLALKANYDNETIECIAQGINASGCNGYALRKEVTYTFKHGDRLELGLGKYIYETVFEKEEPEEDNPRKKIKLTNEENSPNQRLLSNDRKEKWQFIDKSLLIYTPNVDLKGKRVASFDLDGTLITTKSGQRFPKDTNDWTLSFGNIQQKLKDQFLQGYRIVIFSNQLKLGQEPHRMSAFKEKIENILQKLDIPIQVFLATQRDIFRKPAPGMWNTFLESISDDIDINESFYVGDAAGRQKNWAPRKNKDHSIADRLFSINIGLKFHTPEEYFLGARTVFHIMPEFDPRTVLLVDEELPLSSHQEAIIMVGSQGSGKTHFCKRNLQPKGYVYINRDSLGSKQKCFNLVEESLKNKRSIVIDNTNPDVDSRKPFIDLCRKYQVPCKCFHMATPHKHCKHNNKFRSLTDKGHIPVSDIIINSYNKKFQEPVIGEGFVEIHKFQFNAMFKNESEEKLYKMFLLES